MKLKKTYNGCVIIFDIIGTTTTLTSSDILGSLIESLMNIKFINRTMEFNDLIKIQQKYKKYILVDYDTQPLDELKLLSTVIYNFLIITKQHNILFPEEIHLTNDDSNSEIIIFSTEKLNISQLGNFTVSPTIRAEWIDPIMIENIIRHS